jgi:3-oxoacyl-[acyl-carrier-protein] synthase-3
MTALIEVGCHVPTSSVDIDEVCAAAGADERLIWKFRRVFGLRAVRRAPDLDQLGIMTAAVRTLAGLPGNEHRIRYVIHARSISIAHRAGDRPLEDLCADLGLTNAIAFTLTQQACAGGLLAIDVAGRLLAAGNDPDALALVITGEKTFSPWVEFIPESTAYGECTGACLVGPDGPADRLLGYAARTLGQFAADYPPYPLGASFLEAHNDMLARVIRAAVADAGLDMSDVALILPHNVNKLTWFWTCRLLGVPVERVFLDNIAVTGHCFAADPFVNHVHARTAGRLRPGDVYVMASVGLGATFGAAVLHH